MQKWYLAFLLCIIGSGVAKAQSFLIGPKVLVSYDHPAGSIAGLPQPTTGYSIGIPVQLQMAERWVLSTGLMLTHQSELVKVRAGCEITPQGIDDPKSSIQYFSKQLRAPVLFSYRILDKRLSIDAGLGFSADIYVHRRTKVCEVCPDTTATYEKVGGAIPSPGGSALLEITAGYRMTDKLYVQFHPYSYRTLITLHNSGNMVSHSTGLSVLYSLGKQD
jgi:hypothetical protein